MYMYMQNRERTSERGAVLVLGGQSVRAWGCCIELLQMVLIRGGEIHGWDGGIHGWDGGIHRWVGGIHGWDDGIHGWDISNRYKFAYVKFGILVIH